MSAFIALDDGRVWWAANWAYDHVIERIAAQLDREGEHRELAAWLQQQTCLERGPGLGYIDVRELSPCSRKAFRSAARRAFRLAILAGRAGWNDPSFFDSWIAGFRRLLRMWKAIDRGETPGQLGDGADCAEPSGLRLGPGWSVAE